MRFYTAMILSIFLSSCGSSRSPQDPSQVDPNYNPYAQQAPGYGPSPGTYGPAVPYSGASGAYGPSAQPSPAPNPLALPCQNDSTCLGAKCNLQTQRCAFPCATTNDCAQGFTCLGAGTPAAICSPFGGIPGTH